MESIPNNSLSSSEGTTVLTYIGKGDKLHIHTTKVDKRPNHYQTGRNEMNKHGLKGIDLMDELVASTKAEQFLLIAIKNGIGYSNEYHYVVRLRPSEYTVYQQKLLLEGYQGLFKRNLVRRVKRGHYMINPNALIPMEYKEAVEFWNTLPGYDVEVCADMKEKKKKEARA